MDEAAAHEQMWHEDDELHQAEGVLSARLRVSVEEAVNALQTHAAAEGSSRHDVARRVIEGTVIIEP
jgi:AmiR/NasT family two-component response regulator